MERLLANEDARLASSVSLTVMPTCERRRVSRLRVPPSHASVPCWSLFTNRPSSLDDMWSLVLLRFQFARFLQ